MLKIGNVQIEQTAALAPMASVADRAYRTLCKEYGACYMVSEMVSAKGLCYNEERASDLMTLTSFERPMAIQLFGSEPEFMEKAVKIALKYTPDIIDINMGCPVPKVISSNSGSALMKDEKLAGEIVKAAVKASSVPVTVKFRTGWDENNINAVSFAQRIEQCGASAATIHGRTKTQMYGGKANWDIIAKVKEALTIPLIANGDVFSPEDAKALYNHTGADLIMVGRGSYGRPWIFEQIADYLKTGSYKPDPSLEKKLEIMKKHIESICMDKGELIGMKEARAQASHYLKGINGAAKFRAMCGKLCKLSDVDELIETIIKNTDK